MKYLIPILLTLAACVNPFKKDNEPKDPMVMKEQVMDKDKLYRSLTTGDQYGFTHLGDGLLFACLKHAAGIEVNWHAAEMEPGRYERHPDLQFPGDSSSTMSKDHALGLLYCIWKDQDDDSLSRFIHYLEGNGWDLCGGRENASSESVWAARCKVSLTLKATMYEMRFRLGGGDHPARIIPQVWDPWSEDFETHLRVLHTILRGEMMGGINDLQVDFLWAKARDNPRNALYQAAYHRFMDGDQSYAYAALLDESLWPADKLPNGENFCSEYLYQRDEGSGEWQTCPDHKDPWPAIDWIFAAWVAQGMQW